MAQANTFPTFLSVDFDNASGFRDFKAAAAEAGSYVKQQFAREMSDVQNIVQKALTLPAGASGALNLDTSGMRAAAAQAEVTARATREVATAMETAANAANDYSGATRRTIQVAQTAAREAEEEARALTQKAAAYERVQAELSRTGSQIAAYTGANRQLVASQRAVNQASIGAGQQLQDIAISLYGGQKAGVVFAQQLPQMAFALSALEGSTNKTAASVGKFATFLSGPWGLAVGLAVGALATLVASLFETDEVAKKATQASDGLSEAQGVLGGMFDLTTGKVKAQNEVLRLNIQLMAIQLRAEAMKAKSDAADAITNAGQRSWSAWLTAKRPGAAREVHDTVARRKLLDIMAGKGGDTAPADAAKWAETADFSGVDMNRQEFLEGLKAAVEARAKKGTAEEIEKTLKSGSLSSEFMKPGRTRKPRKPADTSDKELRAARAIEDAVASASDAVANLRGQFDAAPKDIDRAAKASLEFDEILKGIERRAADGKLTDAQKKKDEETRRLIKDAQDNLLPEFRQRPVNDRIKSADKELQIQRLLLQGRDDEADKLAFTHDLMRQLNVDTEEQLQAELNSRNISKEKLDLLYAQQEQLRENARIQERMDRSVRSVGSKLQELDRARSSVEQSIAGLPDDARASLKGLVANLRSQVNEIIARRIADNLFGNLFTRLEDQIKGKKPIDMATENFVGNTIKASAALIDLTEALVYSTSTIRGAANDNILAGSKITAGSALAKAASKSAGGEFDPDADIVVTARRSKADREQRQTTEALEKTSKSLSDLARSAAEGAFIGQTASSLVFGNKGSAAGSAIGGAIGKIAGDALGKTIGGTLGKFAGPLGSIAGGLIGGALGKVFMGTKKGTATIGGTGDTLSIASYGGNSKKFQQAAGTGADSAISTINRIADMLGAGVNAAAGSVSIGVRDGKYRVDTTGRGITKVKKGAIDFGDDAEAAIRAATMDLIKDGVLTGLKASTLRLLKQGKDLDAAVEKALDFESVFTRLKEYKDPVGAELDSLDKEFTRLQKIFREAGASAAEYADLERLYGLERAKAVEEAVNRVAGSLKDLYSDLTVGDNGKSLRDRLSAAQAAYDPLKARVAAGDRTAYDAFAKAAQDLLGIQREFSGSQSPYFNLLNEVTALTKSAIDRETNIASISENRDSPFSANGQASNASAPVVSAIQQQTQDLLKGIATIVSGNPSNDNGGGGRFVLRSFS